MDKKTIIGHIYCPVCTSKDAEVKEDKNGHAFAFCPDCATQVFTRNDYRDRHLRRNMRPVTVSVTAAKQIEPPVTVTEPISVPKAAAAATAKKPAIPVPATTPAKTPEPQTIASAPAKKSGWLTPLLGGE